MHPDSLVWALLRRLHAPIYRRRISALVRLIRPHLRPDDRVLDVGCGFGALGRALLDAPHAVTNLSVVGLEKELRVPALIPIKRYAGGEFPYPDRWADVVILADVLHHDPDPGALLREAARVSRRLVVIKDHAVAGPVARQRLALMDWAANRPYDAGCLYRYNTVDTWHRIRQRHGFALVEERDSLSLYPPVVDSIFGGRLQYFAVLAVDPRALGRL